MSRDRFSLAEFALVIFLAFGSAIVTSVAALLQGSAAGVHRGYWYGESHLYGVVVWELICLPIVLAILYGRGWRPADFPIGIGRAATILGIVIAVSTWIFGWLLDWSFGALFSSLRPEMELMNDYRPARPPSLVAIYILSVVNPLFEELLVCGYVVRSLAGRFGITTAINVSVTIRAAYHLYQGIAALPFHVSYGLIQAYVFVRFRNLWPLIVSHALLDFFALLYFW